MTTSTGVPRLRSYLAPQRMFKDGGKLFGSEWIVQHDADGVKCVRSGITHLHNPEEHPPPFTPFPPFTPPPIEFLVEAGIKE